jgi:hypothetical protein
LSGPGTVVSAVDLAALGDADAVRAVWDQLDEVQRRSLIANEPMITGNLNGIPIQFRAEANRLNMRAEIARIDRQLAVVGEASLHNELSDRETIPGLRKLRGDLNQFLGVRQVVHDAWGKSHDVVGVPVVAFDPGDSTIATYRGPLDEHGDVPTWITNLAIHVPGTGTNHERSGELYDRADELRREEGAGATAIFAWAGGRLPLDIPEATDPGFSQALGPRLRDFAAAVNTNPAGSTLTVTGHSYGGAVVGIAEAEGLRADRVLYVSAAGLGHGNKRVSDFPFTGAVPHYALMARNDVVVGSIQGALIDFMHGASPLTDADVVRLETGFLDVQNPVRNEDIESLGGIASHSEVSKWFDLVREHRPDDSGRSSGKLCAG